MVNSSIMKSLVTVFILFLGFNLGTIFSQPESISSEGAISLGESDSQYPVPGTVQWTGKDFKGWNGFTWVSLSRFSIEDVIMDISGNSYSTIKIGNQEWMAENLRTSLDRYGNPLELSKSNWQTSTNPKFCFYDNLEDDFKLPFGALYDWNTCIVNMADFLCPIGWRLPNNTDWTILQSTLGGNQVAGSALKEEGESHWNNVNVSATNSSGFTAVGGGYRTPFGSFNFIGVNTYFWSATPTGSNAFVWTLTHNSVELLNNFLDKNTGVSVRCIKE